MSVIKNMMTLIGYNTSANLDAIRSENLTKSKLTTTTVDDKSVQVGGQQRIINIDGYSMPLVCKGGLMYLELLGIPTDKDLQTYPSVHLTSLMNGIHLYWIMYIQRPVGSLIGQMIPMKVSI